MDWSTAREAFPTLTRKTYLNTCSLGLLSVDTRAAVTQFLDLWEEYGASAWYRIWLSEVQACREKFARLINASPDEIAILPNVSSALSILASCDVPGTNVVSASMDFPTIPYQWHAKPGMEVRLAPTPDDVSTPFSGYESNVDRETAWLATSHVFYTSGAIQDARRLAGLAHANGALFLLDAYQATGQIPVDVKALDCDAYLTGGLKWLLGGPGICYLYVKRELHERLAPTATGWFAHADQFAFDTSTFRPHADARRFEAGTPAVAAVYAGSAGLDTILRHGPAAIAARTTELARDLAERLEDAGYQLAAPEDPTRRSAIVAVRRESPAPIVKALAAEGIIVDHRPGRVRVSPYFYNTVEENERFVNALARASQP